MKRALLSICSSHSLIANAARIVKETKHFHHSRDLEASRWEETSECTHAYPWRYVKESTSTYHHAILEGKGVGQRNRVERGNVYPSLLIPTIHSEVWRDGDSWNWYFVDSPWWWSWVLANLLITQFSNHTLHQQWIGLLLLDKGEGMLTQLNGNEFSQVYSMKSRRDTHSQTEP